MATELYGVDARLVSSIGTTPISTNTNLIFIGACPTGDLNKPVLITSMSDYASKLGGGFGDGYNLTDAAIAAFMIANIDKCWMIPVSHSRIYDVEDYVNVQDRTGILTINNLLVNNPSTVNIFCMPCVSDVVALGLLDELASHLNSFIVYDLPQAMNQVDPNGIAHIDTIVEAKTLISERARAVWGSVMFSDYPISGAAVQACLMAVSDANYGVPARCGGNLQVDSVQNICIKFSVTEADRPERIIVATVNLTDIEATKLSADGICSWINYGGGNWRTWGDHTSVYSAGSVDDERARFDNYIRMQMMLANRFKLKYRFSIDDPMTLQMRNDVITEEEDYLNSLVAIGALIGQPKVEFVPADNTIDQVAQGYFTWSISTTEAPPLKYMLAKIAYTQAGLDVFTQEG